MRPPVRVPILGGTTDLERHPDEPSHSSPPAAPCRSADASEQRARPAGAAAIILWRLSPDVLGEMAGRDTPPKRRSTARDEHAMTAPTYGTDPPEDFACLRHLTPAERRVAMLVATGATNREIGSRVGVSSKTVEAHLTRIYRKLGARSRVEVAIRIAREAPTLTDTLPNARGRC
jgi:DNA-binding NarL/FixJ family response regulator